MAKKYWTAEDLTAAGYSGGQSQQQVYSITDAAAPQSEAVGSRAKSYAFKMFLRIVFIVAAVLVDGLWQWVFLACATVVPWLAVVVANGDSRQQGSGFSAYLPQQQRAAIAAAQADRVHREREATKSADRNSASEASPPATDQLLIIDGEIVSPDGPA